MRTEVICFANAMELKLGVKDKEYGDSWKHCEVQHLRNRLEEEIAEYTRDYDAQELVDIANICMMLWNRRAR